MPVKQSILVIDHNERLRKALGFILQRAGYMVTTMDSSVGVEKFIGLWPCDLIIIDINQPALEGAFLPSTIHRLAPDLRIVLLANQRLQSSSLPEPDEQTLEVLMKPVDPVEILDCVAALFTRVPHASGWLENYTTSIITLN